MIGESCHIGVTLASVTGIYSNLKLFKDINVNGTVTEVN